jgi:hypothetical protein
LSIAFSKAVATNPAGIVTIPTPIIKTKKVKILPPKVIGYTSPYPTVVKVTIEHHAL